jgi:ABC-2 type transport system ATP-binding protein
MEIILKNVTKRFGASVVLDNINMHLLPGVVYGFQGINGSGKTMLMRAISGLIHPTSGEILIDGRKLEGENSFPKSMGILIETPSFLNNHSGFENLKMLTSLSQNPISDDKINKTLDQMGLGASGHMKVRKYSLGMRQRLGIACAIMESPELLILDEPFNSLDESGIACVQQIIKESKRRGTLVIIACHDYELLSSVSDEIFKIVAGKITRHTFKDDCGNFAEA